MRQCLRKSTISLILLVLLVGCSPVTRRHRLTKMEVIHARSVGAPVKIHLHNGSVILSEHGFTVVKDTIRVEGARFTFSLLKGAFGIWSVPLDSVVAMEYFDKRIDGARAGGSFLLGASIAAEIGVATIVVLKMIFGSCPTVYTFDDGQEHLDAECFSYSIGRMFESADLDRLSQKTTANGQLTLRVKNEALETHYIDMLKLCYVDHPEGTEAFPTDDGNIVIAKDLVSPVSAVNSEGVDVLQLIRHRDGIVYEIDSATVSRMFSSGARDWVECTVPIPGDASTFRVALLVRNSLQNTVLLYDIMMRDQGLNALDWSKALNEDPWYAWNLYRWYTDFSGIELHVKQRGRYVKKGKIRDAGPIAWRTVATQKPLRTHGDTLTVRLSFLPDNWTIDWIGFVFDDRPVSSLQYANCVHARDNFGASRYDAVTTIERDDGRYLVTYPSEWVDISFAVPPKSDTERTFFLSSKGYYVEWVRGDWVRGEREVPGFALSEKEEIMGRLAEVWIAKKKGYKKQFFEHRIPAWNHKEKK